MFYVKSLRIVVLFKYLTGEVIVGIVIFSSVKIILKNMVQDFQCMLFISSKNAEIHCGH